MAAPGRSPPLVSIVGSQACERFAFHALASVLALYANEHLLYPERDARAGYHLFLAATFLAPLLGAWLSERVLGRYAAILALSVVAAAGYAAVGSWETRTGLAAGLALVAAGTGALRPCASEFVGEQLGGGDRGVEERARRWLHAAVNVGAVAAALAVPLLLVRSGPRVALAVPGALMGVAVALLWAGRRRHVRAPPAGPNPHGLVRVVRRAVSRLGTGPRGAHWLDGARDAHPADAVEGVKAVLRTAGVFAAVTPFWALFDQKGSSWVFQARRLDLSFLGHQASPAQLQALNPLLVLALAPLLGRVVFPALERRGVSVPPVRRIGWGMFATVLAFAAAAILQTLVDAGRAPHAAWQLPQYALLTLGEVLVSVTALELGYAQAPRAMRGTITSLWALTVFAGNLLTAAVAALVRLEGAGWFWTFAGLMLVAAIAFVSFAGRERGARARIEPAG